MDNPSRVRMSGPLEPYRHGFTADLGRLGYSKFTVAALLHLMAHLSCWLEDQGLGAGDLTDACVERFLAARRATGQVCRLSPRGLIPLLEYLRGLNVAPEPVPPVASTPLERLLEEFTGFLLHQRGLAPGTVTSYQWMARAFLSVRGQQALDLDRLGADDVYAFLLTEANQRSAGSLNNIVTALRALLRFLHLRGYTAQSLAEAVPRAATRWSGPPQPLLDGDDVTRLLASCDRRTNAGRRDYAMLTVLARLGLRAAEVAALNVDDVHWRVGEIIVCSKGGQRDRLPLPDDVGQALAAYCRRGRRRGEDRHLFLHVRAPYRGMAPSAVSEVVARACRRAGLPPVGAHRLRHAAATALRRAGVPLAEINQLLRHRYLATTARYAHEDLDALAEVACPWPGGAA